MDLLPTWHDTEMHSLLTSMELNLISNSSILHVDSNDMNSFKCVFLRYIAINIIVIDPQIKSVCNQLTDGL